MKITSKDRARFQEDPYVGELERVERQIWQLAKDGELFEPETLDGKEASLPKSKRVERLLRRRDELIELVRPQCVDPENDQLVEDVKRVAKEQFGIDWKEPENG